VFVRFIAHKQKSKQRNPEKLRSWHIRSCSASLNAQHEYTPSNSKIQSVMERIARRLTHKFQSLTSDWYSCFQRTKFTATLPSLAT